MSVKDLHREAMDLADQAFLARQKGDEIRALELTRMAFKLEREAALQHAQTNGGEPTRSVLLRSAASLALKCAEQREAEKLACVALAHDPPDEVAEELRDLLEQAQMERHLALRGVELSSASFQMSLSGGDVGVGMAPPLEFVDRVAGTQKLIVRTGERKARLPFRDERRGLPGGFTDLFEPMMSTLRAGSLSVTFTLKRRTGQLEMFPSIPADVTPESVLEDLLTCLSLAQNGDEQKLRATIADDAYFENFKALASRLAPDGHRVGQVGFTGVSNGRPQKIALTPPTRLWLMKRRSTQAQRGTGGPYELRGELKKADSTKSKDTIVVVPRDQPPVTLVVPRGLMGDIVKPLWGELVDVVAERRGARAHLVSVVAAPEGSDRPPLGSAADEPSGEP